MSMRHASVALLLSMALTSQARGQDDISGKFYRFQVVGRAGLRDVTDLL